MFQQLWMNQHGVSRINESLNEDMIQCHLPSSHHYALFNILYTFHVEFLATQSALCMPDTTYTLFGGVVSDYLLQRQYANTTMNLHDYDFHLVFGNYVDAEVQSFIAMMAFRLRDALSNSRHHNMAQVSQQVDTRYRTAIIINNLIFDISYCFLSELSHYSIEYTTTPSKPVVEPFLTLADRVSIDRVHASSAGISAVAMYIDPTTLIYTMWVSRQCMHDIEHKTVTQVHAGNRHQQYTQALYQRKYNSLGFKLMDIKENVPDALSPSSSSSSSTLPSSLSSSSPAPTASSPLLN